MSDASREAAEAGEIAFFERFRDRGGNLDDRDEYEQTPLYIAANNGRLALVRWLLDQGADPEGHAFDCEVKYYLNPNARSELRGRWTLLHAAAMTASIETMELLIDERRYDVDVRDDGGWTPLHVLSYYPFASTAGIDALLARGADVDAADALGQNALCKARDAAIARHLIEKGARVDGGDHVPSTPGGLIGSNPERPIDRFAFASDLEMVEYLLARGAKPSGATLQHAVYRANAALVDRLLPLISPDEVAEALPLADDPALYERLLALASKLPPAAVYMVTGTPWKLRALLARGGAPVDEPNAEGWTPMHAAARAGDRECVQLLLAHQANIHAKLPNGQTPLHVAADGGNLEMVKLLVEAGADPSAVAGKKTPRALAYGRGTPQHDVVAQFLEPLTKVAPAPVPAAPMAVGSSVSHPKFGTGTVVAREGDKLRVKFSDGEKVLLARVLTAASGQA